MGRYKDFLMDSITRLNSDLTHNLIGDIKSFIKQSEYELDICSRLSILFDKAEHSKNLRRHFMLAQVAFDAAKAEFLLLKKHINPNTSHDKDTMSPILDQLSNDFLSVESLYNQIDKRESSNISIALSATSTLLQKSTVNINRIDSIHQINKNFKSIDFNLSRIHDRLKPSDISYDLQEGHLETPKINKDKDLDHIIYEKFKYLRQLDNEKLVCSDKERVIVECQDVDISSDLNPPSFTWSDKSLNSLSADVYNGEICFSTFADGKYSLQSFKSAQQVLREVYGSEVTATIVVHCIKSEKHLYDLLSSINLVSQSEVDHIHFDIPDYLHTNLLEMLKTLRVPTHLVESLNHLNNFLQRNSSIDLLSHCEKRALCVVNSR